MTLQVNITRSTTNADLYFLTVSEDDEVTGGPWPLNWKHLENINVQVVNLRSQDAQRYAFEEAAEGQYERDRMRGWR